MKMYEDLCSAGFSVCCEDRNFAAGGSLIEQMEENVGQSRRILLIYSKNRDQSRNLKWKTVNAAHEGIEKGIDNIIPIIMNGAEIPEEYNQMTCLKTDEVYMWERLCNILAGTLSLPFNVLTFWLVVEWLYK